MNIQQKKNSKLVFYKVKIHTGCCRAILVKHKKNQVDEIHDGVSTAL